MKLVKKRLTLEGKVEGLIAGRVFIQNSLQTLCNRLRHTKNKMLFHSQNPLPNISHSPVSLQSLLILQANYIAFAESQFQQKIHPLRNPKRSRICSTSHTNVVGHSVVLPSRRKRSQRKKLLSPSKGGENPKSPSRRIKIAKFLRSKERSKP